MSNEELVDIERLISTSELPQEVRDRILSIANGSGITGTRRIEVAKELIAHFDDGLAAGRSVRELLDTFVEIAPNPLPREAATREVKPAEDNFSGFIFKIHANIDPKHRKFLEEQMADLEAKDQEQETR